MPSLDAPLKDDSQSIALSCRVAKSGPLTSQCSPRCPLLHFTVASVQGGRRGCQQALCVCRLMLLPCSESPLRGKVPPTAAFFFIDLSLFTLPMGLNSCSRIFLSPEKLYPPPSLPCVIISRCLDSNLREALSLLFFPSPSSPKS